LNGRGRVLAFSLLALLPACKRSSDQLSLYFRDDLVEAPARTVDVVALSGADCRAVLSKRHDEEAMGSAGTVLARRGARYPLNPDAKVLENLPRGTPLALDVATYDRDQIQMARACQVITLDPAGQTKVEIEMRALPICDAPASTVDVSVVVDVSNQIAAADPSNVHLVEFDQHIIAATARFAMPATWTVFTDDDPDGAKELVPATTDVEVVKNALISLVTMHSGNPRAYDAVTIAAKKLRARSICGTRPAIIVFLGDQESFSTPGAREDAVVGIVATRGDMTDDIYTFGIALSNGAYDELNDMIPLDVGTAQGAQGDLQLRNSMNAAGKALKDLVQ
jgi:hypothetical protein